MKQEWKNNPKLIEAALADPNPGNEIARAVAVACAAFADRLKARASVTGGMPRDLMLYRPRTAFDRIVIRRTLQEIADNTGVGIRIHWVGGA